MQILNPIPPIPTMTRNPKPQKADRNPKEDSLMGAFDQPPGTAFRKWNFSIGDRGLYGFRV